VLLLAEMFFPERVKMAKPAPTPAAAVVAVMLFCCINTFGAASDALKNYENGKFARARDQFEYLAKKNPDDTRLRYNAGAAAFRDESYEDALRHFSASLSSRDIKLQEQSYYNLGNTNFRLGEHAKEAKEKQQSWEQAVHDYENALKLDPNDKDAKFNREVVQQKLEELKKQRQQQQQKKDQQNSDENKNDQQKQDQQKKDDQKKQNDKSEQEKKQDQQKSEEQKKDGQSQQQKQDQQKQEKEDQSKEPQQQQAPQDQRGEQPDKASQAAQYNRVMQMTPQQAAQLLEAQKAEEKAMIFVPQNVKTNKNPNRVFKDW
jgi:Ca-activated chloride channel family protein